MPRAAGAAWRGRSLLRDDPVDISTDREEIFGVGFLRYGDILAYQTSQVTRCKAVMLIVVE